MVGTILAAVFAATRFGGQLEDLHRASQLWIQLKAAGLTALWPAAASYTLLGLTGATVPLHFSVINSIP